MHSDLVLYQYRGRLDDKHFAHLSDLLQFGKLWFSPPNSFNDPFDCYPRNADFAASGLPHAIVDQMNHAQQRAAGALVGIACFTTDPANHVMWAHYGAHHKSVCIGFDSKILRERTPQNDQGHPLYQGPFKMKYSEERSDEDAPDRFLVKSMAWTYEAEHRLFASKRAGTPSGGPGAVVIPCEAICEIVLGARMRAEVQASVEKLATEHVPHAVLRKVVIHSSTYELVVENLADQPTVPPLEGHVYGPDGEWIPVAG